jgi:hypothetical protein
MTAILQTSQPSIFTCARAKTRGAVLVLAAALSLPAWCDGTNDVARAGSVDAGREAFPLCMSCHADPPTASRFDTYRFNTAGLTAAFQQIPQMRSNLTLGTQTINDIASYLGLPDDRSNDTDRLLDWAEDTFPTLLSPRRQVTGQALGYKYRFYPNTGVYAGSKDGFAWFWDSRTPDAVILNLGTLRSFLNQMPNGR